MTVRAHLARACAVASVLVVVAATSACQTPCCFCYCGEVPVNALLEASSPARAELPAPSAPTAAPTEPTVVVARY